MLTEAGERLLAQVEAMAQAASSIDEAGDTKVGIHLTGILRVRYRAEGGHYRDGRDARAGYDGRCDGRYAGYGREGQGWHNGYYPSRGYPGAVYGGYGYGPLGYAPLRGYGPAGYAGWAYGGVYGPAVVVVAPAYRGWGVGYGYGYVAAPVVVAAPVYHGWGYRGY